MHWQPMSPGQGALAWRPGVDYWIELPDGERTAPLAAVWNDRRSAEAQLFFAVQDAAGGAWRVEVKTPQGILTKAGERLPYNHVFRFAGDRWAMVTGCVARQDGADLAIPAHRRRQARAARAAADRESLAAGSVVQPARRHLFATFAEKRRRRVLAAHAVAFERRRRQAHVA